MAFLRPVTLLRIFGLAMCVLSAGFASMELLLNHSPARTAGNLLEVLCQRVGVGRPGIVVCAGLAIGCFAALFWMCTGLAQGSRLAQRWLPALAAQSIVGLTVSPELLMLVSFQVALLAEVRMGLWCIGVQSVLQVAAYYWQAVLTGSHPLLKLMDVGPERMWLVMLLVAATSIVCHFLAFSLGLLGSVERRRALELTRINAELEATRQLESDTARLAERLSLSRELHDACGHHLAALSVNLRLTRHISEREAIQEKLDESLVVVQNLLADVRNVVRDLREEQTIDLKALLTTLARGLTGLTVHLAIEEELSAAGTYHAHTLFRCAQEIMTNTVKHAMARNLWLRMARTSQGFVIESRDDGRGTSKIEFGTGLTGMRDRVLELGGRFEAHSRAGEGFRLELELPVRGRAA